MMTIKMLCNSNRRGGFNNYDKFSDYIEWLLIDWYEHHLNSNKPMHNVMERQKFHT